MVLLARNNLTSPVPRLASALALSAALHAALIYGIAGDRRNMNVGAEKKSVVIDVSLVRDSELGPLSPSPLGGEGGVRGLSVLIPATLNYGTLNKVSITENSATDATLPAPMPKTGQTLIAPTPVAIRPPEAKAHAYPPVAASGKNVDDAAATTTATTTAATVTAVTTFAKALAPVRPDYPATARERNITGRVTAKLLIDETGAVVNSSVVNAEPAGHFEASALAALRSTHFSPATRNGVAVKSEQQMVVTYQLE